MFLQNKNPVKTGFKLVIIIKIAEDLNDQSFCT